MSVDYCFFCHMRIAPFDPEKTTAPNGRPAHRACGRNANRERPPPKPEPEFVTVEQPSTTELMAGWLRRDSDGMDPLRVEQLRQEMLANKRRRRLADKRHHQQRRQQA